MVIKAKHELYQLFCLYIADLVSNLHALSKHEMWYIKLFVIRLCSHTPHYCVHDTMVRIVTQRF